MLKASGRFGRCAPTAYCRAVARPRLQRAEPLENLSTRLPETTAKRLRRRAVDDEISIQEFIEQAVTRELHRRDKLRSRRTTKQP